MEDKKMAKKVIEINPVSRLEGEAKISIFLMTKAMLKMLTSK
jgi:coenzyme F420-reducing hydrogenase alpha subunit